MYVLVSNYSIHVYVSDPIAMIICYFLMLSYICSYKTAINFIVRKNWTCMPSASGSYSRLAGRQNRDELQNF